MNENNILVDRFNRKIIKLRISITSECNLNCPYCHKEGHYQDKINYLSLNQIIKIVEICKRYNINYIKITGGEPLLHPEIIKIIELFNKNINLKDLSITTNGTKLEELAVHLKKAGLMRINIGCDSIQNSSLKNLKRIQKGILSSKEVGLSPIKLNMVVLKDINQNEINEIIEYCRDNNLILQLIELIDYNHDFYNRFHVDLTDIENEIKNKSIKVINREFQNRKQYVLNNGAVIEIVRPMHNSLFCSKCNTLRVTSDYKFKPCLNRDDNLVPIEEDIQKSLLIAINNREPYFK